ncbi:P-loop containing nucleoside triphosphate hydrolase protein [Xylariomycetidae sp. FL0641]|nr:P-loop containing nucleoside triphosphate hydrolase protein [Xylariomycetidae sp. FL0641]
MQEPDAPPTPPPATQYELLRDAGFKHLDHADQDDQRATQRLRDRPVLIGENHASLNAIIESIECVNFMCHQRLHVQLGPLLNFIVGENGSGKSAVLTAITLCLGGKASATNRGGSLRSFVKEGEEQASLTVKIKNQGEDSYKPDVFGETITCERWFTKSGSSGFKLRATNGKIISSKKSDVDDVVEYFCLQVDNPLNVLSQDNARQFLNAATPTLKYKYFVQGTQLEQLDHDYQLLTEMLDANEAKLAEHSDNIFYLKEAYTKAVKLRDALGRSAEMRHTVKLYQKQLAWYQVKQQEDNVEKSEEEIRNANEEIARLEQLVAQKTEDLSTIDNKIHDAEAAVEAVDQEGGQLTDQYNEAKETFTDAKTKLSQMHAQEREIYSKFTRASETVKDYEGLIQEEEKRLEDANGGALATTQSRLEDAKKAVEEAKQAKADHKSGFKELQEAVTAAEGEMNEAQERIKQKQQEITSVEGRVQMLSQETTNPFAGFHIKTPQLLKQIENDSGFSKRPIGPVGSHIQLTRPRWSPVIESVLGKNLNAFIVSNKPDRERLQSHLNRLHIDNAPIIIAPTRLGNNLREPDEQFDTIFRILKFDDQTVRDALVIATGIEQTILIPDRNAAQRVMMDGPPLQNVKACLCFHDKKREGLRLTRLPGEIYATSPVYFNSKQRPRMRSDVDDEIGSLQEQLGPLQSERQTLETSKRTQQQAVQRAKFAETQHKKRASALDKAERDATAQVRTIEDELEEFNGAGGRLQGLKDELIRNQKKKDLHGAQYGEVFTTKKDMNDEIKALKEKLSEAKVALQDHQAKVEKAKDKVNRCNEIRKLTLREKNEAHEKLEIAGYAKAAAEKARDSEAKALDEFREKASRIYPTPAYIPEGESYDSIEKKYESLRDQISKIRAQVGATEEEINDRARKATEEYQAAKKNNKSLTSLVDGLKKALMDRLGKYRDFQRHVSAHARTNFGYLLSERGFRGQLLLDHKSKKLEIQVEPDETRKTGKGRNTKTLSGGEKSFSSICLLLAIWDAMGSPLRCLDEFDVFMDNVNRAISTNMLITAARRSVGKQFILITPNAIEGRANIDKDVKIIRFVSCCPLCSLDYMKLT